jgi:hypothetical protein
MAHGRKGGGTVRRLYITFRCSLRSGIQEMYLYLKETNKEVGLINGMTTLEVNKLVDLI